MFNYIVSDTATETLTGAAIAVLELQKSLRLGRIIGTDTGSPKLADYNIVLCGQLLQNINCLVLIQLLSTNLSIDKKKGHPRVDYQEVGLHTSQVFGGTLSSSLVKTIVAVPIVRSTTVKEFLHFPRISHLKQR